MNSSALNRFVASIIIQLIDYSIVGFNIVLNKLCQAYVKLKFRLLIHTLHLLIHTLITFIC